MTVLVSPSSTADSDVGKVSESNAFVDTAPLSPDLESWQAMRVRLGLSSRPPEPTRHIVGGARLTDSELELYRTWWLNAERLKTDLAAADEAVFRGAKISLDIVNPSAQILVKSGKTLARPYVRAEGWSYVEEGSRTSASDVRSAVQSIVSELKADSLGSTGFGRYL